MEISGVASITETSYQTVDLGQVEDTRWSEVSSDAVKDRKQALTPMARAEKAKASRGSLHKAAIRGQYKTVKTLLKSGEDVDLRDQFSLTPLHLACWYGQESVVKLLLQHGANVNAEDRNTF
ncbi:Poly [ADP-ribose] polymerase tankyrase-2 [Porites harrisoni]